MIWIVIAIVINSFTLGVLFGWIYAHRSVAAECKKLGAFYVGDDVFHCTKISKFEEKRMMESNVKNTSGFWRDHGE